MELLWKFIYSQIALFHSLLPKERIFYRVPLVMFIVYLLGTIYKWHSSFIEGRPLDFCIQYAAATLALLGIPESAYNIDIVNQYMAIISNRMLTDGFGVGWFYPPTTLLLFLPFAFFSYLPILYIWIISNVIAYAYILFRLAPLKKMPFVILGFPGLYMNLLFGQNGFFTTILLAFSYYFINHRPYLAGIFAGLLCYKPQFAVLWLLVLLVSKKFKVLFTCASTVIIQALLSWLFFGTKTWLAYWDSIEVCIEVVLKSGWDHFNAIHPSVFAVARFSGFDINNAFLIQGILAITIAVCIIYVCIKRPITPMLIVLVVTGTFLSTPYVNQYDLAILALPIALYAYEGIESGWLEGEKMILISLWVMPLLNWPIVYMTSVQVAPFFIFLVFACALRRIIYMNKQ